MQNQTESGASHRLSLQLEQAKPRHEACAWLPAAGVQPGRRWRGGDSHLLGLACPAPMLKRGRFEGCGEKATLLLTGSREEFFLRVSVRNWLTPVVRSVVACSLQRRPARGVEPGFAGVLGLACALGGAVLKGAARVCTVWASGTGSGSDIYPPSATLPFEQSHCGNPAPRQGVFELHVCRWRKTEWVHLHESVSQS